MEPQVLIHVWSSLCEHQKAIQMRRDQWSLPVVICSYLWNVKVFFSSLEQRWRAAHNAKLFQLRPQEAKIHIGRNRPIHTMTQLTRHNRKRHQHRACNNTKGGQRIRKPKLKFSCEAVYSSKLPRTDAILPFHLQRTDSLGSILKRLREIREPQYDMWQSDPASAVNVSICVLSNTSL